MSAVPSLLDLLCRSLSPAGGGPPARPDVARIARDAFAAWSAERDAAGRLADFAAARDFTGEFPADVPQATRRWAAVLPPLWRRRPVPTRLDEDALLGLLPPRVPAFVAGDRPRGIGERQLVEPLAFTDAAECWSARNWMLPDQPPIVLAFFPDRDERMLRLINWHAKLAGVPGLLALEHTYTEAEVACLKFAPVPLFGLHTLPDAAGRNALVEQLITTVAALHARTPPVSPGARAISRGFVSARQGVYSSALLVLAPPADFSPHDDVRALAGHLGLGEAVRERAVTAADAGELLELVRPLLQGKATLADNPVPPPPEPAKNLRNRARRGADMWDKLGTLEPVPDLPKVVTNSVGMRFVLVPAGTFRMGSPPDEPGRRDNEGPQHEVVMTRPYYLGVLPVTQADYLAVTGANPARFQGASGGGPGHPVEMVSYDDAVAFCAKLSDLPAEREAKRSYRLPTEAEWEYACRAGTTTPFAFGSSLGVSQAAFDGNHPYGDVPRGPTAQRTQKAGSFAENRFGVFDMHGNVWEWCADHYDAGYYLASPRQDPPGPASGSFRVLRGGSWRNQAGTCRSAYRNALAPNQRQPFIGFRVVLA